jgi:2-C-methyl-D-erythritol 4-phosphate cytidylyltransferase
MNTAIIVAAGQGTRLAGDRPKQFLDLSGKRVIHHTLSRFQECPAIQSIVLVLPKDGFGDFVEIISEEGYPKLTNLVPGGSTRAESVRNGFLAAQIDVDGVVAVHDGARPLVTSDEIAATVQSAHEDGAACLVADVTDTIKSVDDGSITGTVDRSLLRRALTPQAFRYEIFREMLALNFVDESVTDECFLAEKLGIKIACVSGSSRNIKITHPGDLRLAEMLLADLK